MKKNFRAIIAFVLALMLALPATGLAAGGFDPPGQSSTTTNGTEGRQVIPLYGYIGPDTIIVDPDPTDPEVKPETEIYVELPVKILFAAFEGNNGAITSPDYTITNLSTANNVRVEIADFAQKGGSDLGGQLQLDLVERSGGTLVSGVFPASYPPTKVFAENLSKNNGGSDNVLEFGVGGSWSGDFVGERNPSFAMTLLFSVVE